MNRTTKFTPPDDVIKNPMRNAPRAIPSFEPEHQRLGITPIPRGTVKPDEATTAGYDNEHYSENGLDTNIDPNKEMIDNNDFIFEAYNNMPAQAAGIKKDQQSPTTSVVNGAPQVGHYILMVNSKLLLSGTIQTIEQRVKDILYKEDKEFSDQNITVDDIVVLKRIEIKVGVFVSE